MQHRPFEKSLRPVVVLLLAGLLLTACASQRASQPLAYPIENPRPVDLAGSWERDYARSDDVNQQLGRLFRKLNRMNRDQRYSNYPGPTLSERSATSLMALAQLAELVTRPTVLTITHTDDELRVEREGDFDMICEFHNGLARGIQSAEGTEVCGWIGQQFVTRLNLPDGVTVSHRFTVSPDRQDLHVATTVSSPTSSMPFTLNRFYTRFEPLPENERCVETLTRKRVCTLNGGGQ